MYICDYSIVLPNSRVGKNIHVEIGSNVYIASNCEIQDNTIICDRVILGESVRVMTDTKIKENTRISAFTNVCRQEEWKDITVQLESISEQKQRNQSIFKSVLEREEAACYRH